MNHIVKLPSDLEARLQQHAIAQGLSADGYISQLLHQALLTDNPPTVSKQPRRSSLGVLTINGPIPSIDDINEVRREMWANFPRDIG